MKYVVLIVDETGYWETLPEEKRAQAFDRIGEWWGDLSQKGTIVGGHQLQPAHTATTVKVHGGKAEVADGPFFKEAVGGYGILDVANLVDGPQPGRVPHIGACGLECLETSDRVFDIGMAADVVLGSCR